MKFDCRYNYAGHFTSDGAWKHPVFCLQTWEMVCMLSGTACLFEEDREFEAHAGEAFLFAPGKTHGGTRSSTGVSFFWLHVDSGSDGTETLLGSLPQKVKLAYPSQMSTLFRQLLHHAESFLYPDDMKDAFASLIFAEYHAQSPEAQENGSYLLNDIGEWIRVHIHQPMNAGRVAEQFQYNEDYLTQLFRARTGRGLKAFIDGVRMDKIKNLLLTTDKPLKSIAAETGFEDYKAFLKFFTYHESVTPTVFRTQYYKKHTNIH